MNARRDIGELLAGQLDSIEADMAARAKPYADNIDLRRRVNIASAFVADQDCTCEVVHGGAGPLTRECAWHYLTRVLEGDE